MGKVSKRQATSTKTVEKDSKQTIEQEVLRHYAKTVYFNDLWKSFLSKIAGLVAFMAVVTLQRMGTSKEGLGFAATFEILSLLITITTVFFIQRWKNPLLAFKIAFLLSILQVSWWSYVTYTLHSLQGEFSFLSKELLPNQLPFGSMYFGFSWAADRFMIRSHDLAKQNAMEIQQVLHKTE